MRDESTIDIGSASRDAIASDVVARLERELRSAAGRGTGAPHALSGSARTAALERLLRAQVAVEARAQQFPFSSLPGLRRIASQFGSKNTLDVWCAEIRRSKLFNAEYYLEQLGDPGALDVEPLYHFILNGAYEGRNPNQFFDVDWYLGRYPDVTAAGFNPLLHYIRVGARERRLPHAAFDPAAYLAANPDVGSAGTSPLRHYLWFGLREGRSKGDEVLNTKERPAAPALAAFREIAARKNEATALSSIGLDIWNPAVATTTLQQR